jgi:hypothetical protein
VWNNSFKNDNVLGDLNCNHNIFPNIRGTLALDAWKNIIHKLVESLNSLWSWQVQMAM